MARTDKKVRFGLRNVHYAKYTPPATAGQNGTYGTSKALPGAVSLTINREGDENSFYADDIKYATFTSNMGYTGELSLAYMDDELKQDLLNFVVDSHGMLIEDTDAQPAVFALMFETSSNISGDRFVYYNCTLSRPETEANTRTDSTDPDTDTLNITMSPMTFAWGTGVTKDIVSGHVADEGDTRSVYASFMDAVLIPTPSA